MNAGTLLALALGSVLIGAAGWLMPGRLQKSWPWFATAGSWIAFLASFGMAITCWGTSLSFSWVWLETASLQIPLEIRLNNPEFFFLAVVTLVAALVQTYSLTYMRDAIGRVRFFSGVAFFTWCMLMLILLNNLLLVFMAWELMGFASWLLIGHDRQRNEAGIAATKAFLTNRISDAALLGGILLIQAEAGTLDLGVLLSAQEPVSSLAALLVFTGVVGKSAQFPLFTWLPDAMAGPTPVSALLHAATMVAAGVYILIKIYIIIPTSALQVILYTGIVSAFIGSVSAFFASELKRILAYSTMSQLGLMLMAIGAGVPQVAFLHLVTHAFYKAGMFLATGTILHSAHTTRIQELAGTSTRSVVPFIAMVIFSAAMTGLPLTSGFAGKEGLLEAFIQSESPGLVILFLLLAGLTTAYLTRILYFLIKRSANPTSVRTPFFETLAMLIPAVFSLFWWLNPNPMAVDIWFITPFPAPAGWHSIGMISWIVLASGITWVVLRRIENARLPGEFITQPMDQAIHAGIVQPVHQLAAVSHKSDAIINSGLHTLVYIQVGIAYLAGWFDRNLVDGLVNLVSRLVNLTGNVVRSFQSGAFQLYLFWAVLVIVLFVTWFIL